MPPFRIPSDTVSGLGRGLHDVGLAAMLGGNMFGRLALHPAVADVSDPAERGRVVNHAWRRQGVANTLGLAAVIGGWVGARPNEARGRWLSPRERNLAHAKDAAVAAVAITGVATMVEGIRFSRTEPAGAVPLTDGDTPAPETPDHEARMKRRLNALGTAAIASEVALAVVNASFAQVNFRRPPLRRVLRRRY